MCYAGAMYAVYHAKSADRQKVDEALKDDLISRQSITIREGASIGLSGIALLVLVEGAEDAVKRADERFEFAERLEPGKAEEARKAIRAQEEDAASGRGMIFGN